MIEDEGETHRGCMAGNRRGGSVMREGWAEIWVDRCLWVLGVWPACDLGGGVAMGAARSGLARA